jgi:VWFA-related protein
VVSDGNDTASSRDFDDVYNRLQASNVVVYTVAVVDPLEKSNTKVLRKLAEGSGGEAFSPQSNADIVTVLRHIARDIRHTYTIGYEPADARRDGRFRKITVAARGRDGRKLTTHTRTGYIAGRAFETPQQ